MTENNNYINKGMIFNKYFYVALLLCLFFWLGLGLIIFGCTAKTNSDVTTTNKITITTKKGVPI
jgi:hypothetical protein